MKFLEIFGRILSGSIVIGFILGWIFHRKHKILYEIFCNTAIILVFAGMAWLWMFTVFGGNL